MAKKDNTLLYVAGAAALYFLFIKPKTPVSPPSMAIAPGGGVMVPVVATNPVSSILNAVTSVIKNLGSGSSSTFTPTAPIPEPVEVLPTLDLSEQIAVSPTANITDAYTRNQVNSDYYTQYEESLVSGLHSDGYMGK